MNKLWKPFAKPKSGAAQSRYRSNGLTASQTNSFLRLPRKALTFPLIFLGAVSHANAANLADATIGS
jgi:hypothetical protein